MNNKEKYEYWLEAAKYDLETAKVMIDGGRYVYVAFMCQQSIEKLTKGIYTLYTGDEPPRIHNIWALFKELERKDDFIEVINLDDYEENLEKYKSFLAELLSFYISGRYPNYKQKMSSLINRDRAKRILENTEEAFKWIESLSLYKE